MEYTNIEQANAIIKTQAKQLEQMKEERKPLYDFVKLVEEKLCDGTPCDFNALNMEQLIQMNDNVNKVVEAINDLPPKQ